MSLKKKDLSSQSPSSAAALLPSLMASMAVPHIELPVASLTPAPADWNFFSPLPDGKFLELCDSISQHGLIHPLFIWEAPNGEKIILSGHNRVRALQSLYDATGDAKFNIAPCVIRRDISEAEARSLIIDANWVGRVLSPSEKARCVARRYAETGRLERGTGIRAYDKVAIHFGIKATQVYNYIKIASLPDEVLKKVDSGAISLKAAAMLTKLTEPRLEGLLETLGENLSTESIKNTLNEDNVETLKFTVPYYLVESVKAAVDVVLNQPHLAPQRDAAPNRASPCSR